MKKFLFSIMLSVVFLTSFSIQANTISAPSYQVDLLHSAIDIGSNKVTASNSVKSADSMRSLSQIKNADMNIKKTREPTMILIGQCNSFHSSAADTIGVPGGDSIGIRQLS